MVAHTLVQFLANEWDGIPKRMMINLGAVTLGWGGIAMTHGEFNLWVQTFASLTAFAILLWNFWGSVKEAKRKRLREDQQQQKQATASRSHRQILK